MAYQVTLCEDQPVIQAECLQGFKMGEEMVPLIKELKAILDAAAEKHYVVFDLEGAVFSLDDMIKTANIANQPELSIHSHPNLAGMHVVTTNKVILMGLKGLNTAAFGHLSMSAFPSMSEALAHLHTKRIEMPAAR